MFGHPVYVNVPMFRYSNLLIGNSKQYLTFVLNIHSACKLCLLFKPKQVFITTERLYYFVTYAIMAYCLHKS